MSRVAIIESILKKLRDSTVLHLTYAEHQELEDILEERREFEGGGE